MALVLDAGPLIAFLDRRDRYHAASRFLIERSEETLIIPVPVLAEVDYFIHTRLYPIARVGLLNDIKAGLFEVEQLITQDFDRIREICAQYSDADVGFVDAAVLAVVERLNEPKLATLDREHFAFLRPRHVRALMLLPER